MGKENPKSILDRVTNLVGNKNKLGKLLSGYSRLREANYISSHFSSYLEPVVATDEQLKEEVFRIRHSVYCEELNFEPINESKMEKDEFDAYSLHCLIRHRTSNNFAGTARIVRPLNIGEQLPIQKYCLNSITHNTLNPNFFPKHEICEISRLAVPNTFRRRQMDKFSGSATGVIDQDNYSETELRCFPFIAVGLYFTAASLVMQSGIKHAFVMMEPRLARSMGFVGIKFTQIGPVVDYHGRRAPYYINQELLFENLNPNFKLMLKDINEKIKRSH